MNHTRKENTTDAITLKDFLQPSPPSQQEAPNAEGFMDSEVPEQEKMAASDKNGLGSGPAPFRMTDTLYIESVDGEPGLVRAAELARAEGRDQVRAAVQELLHPENLPQVTPDAPKSNAPRPKLFSEDTQTYAASIDAFFGTTDPTTTTDSTNANGAMEEALLTKEDMPNEEEEIPNNPKMLAFTFGSVLLLALVLLYITVLR